MANSSEEQLMLVSATISMYFILDNIIGPLLTKDMWDVIRSGSLHCTPSRQVPDTQEMHKPHKSIKMNQ